MEMELESTPGHRTEATLDRTAEAFRLTAIEVSVKAGMTAIGYGPGQAEHSTFSTLDTDGAVAVGIIIGIHLPDCPPTVLRLVRELQAAIDEA